MTGAAFRNPERIGAVLESLFSRLGLSDGIRQQQALIIWHDVVGPSIARVSTPLRIEFGRLFIEVESAVWRQEIHYFKRQIIERLNERLGGKVVKDIVVY